MTRSPAPESPELVVRDHESGIAPVRRKALGAHYTPPELARRIVALAVDALGATPRTVADPCCGAGSFLLAAADALVDRGVPPAEVVGQRLLGADADGEAVGAARRALRLWARQRGVSAVDVPEPRLEVADTLLRPPRGWGAVDVVVGNPPFLGQLGRATARSEQRRSAVARRFGAVGPYTDDAALFLLGAVDLVVPGGVVALVQPQSLLGSRDAGPVRDASLETAELVAVWASERSHFDAAVRVCAPVLRRRGAGPPEARSARPTVQVTWDDRSGEVPAPDPGAAWGPLLAAVAGVPELPRVPAGAATVASIASATAGFRDEFYAVASSAREPGEPGWSQDGPRIVTVGMVDAADLAWGRRRARLAGRHVVAPRLDRVAVGRVDPRVARWVAARLVPKVLVATQTRALEAAVDATGDVVPVTPLVSVEPFDASDVWIVAAALLAPPVAARGAAELLGSGRGSRALRWSARSVLAAPLPSLREPWHAAADLVAAAHEDAPRRPELIREAGRLLCEAHGLAADHPVLDWWAPRVGAATSAQ